jgi:restriction system protein
MRFSFGGLKVRDVKVKELDQNGEYFAISFEVEQRAQASTQAVVQAAQSQGPDPLCPNCNRPMAKRTNKKGEPFWGCPGFPQCRGTRPA